MANELRDKLERFKIKAEEFLKDDVKAFITDVNDTYFFCDICIHLITLYFCLILCTCLVAYTPLD